MKDPKRPRIVSLAILTTLTLLAWIAFEVWRAFTRPAPIQVESQIIEPLNPQIDTQVLESLKTKIFFSDEEVKEATIEGGGP